MRVAFDEQYVKWMRFLEKGKSGEALRRLLEGHGHAEKLFLDQVWWPAVGHFDYLHAEYEVWDFKDGVRYLDFAYVRPPYRVCIEIDGYGPHSRDMNRWQFADQLTRQNHLILDDWKVVRFAYDDVSEKPRRCQQIVQQLLGRWFGDETATTALTLKEREILRLAVRTRKPVTPGDVCARLGIGNRHARTLLKQLLSKGLLVPASGQERVRTYRLNPHGKPLFL